MKIIIIGGVAAGMSAAAKASRIDKNAEIVIYEKLKSFHGELVDFLIMLETSMKIQTT